MPPWTPRLGAVCDPDATTFTVWAPEHQDVALVLEPAAVSGGDRPPTRGVGVRTASSPMHRDVRGYWSVRVPGIGPGARYRFRLDGDPARTFPDPASRFQPDGVHGPSSVVDPWAYRWRDTDWAPPSFEGTVFYELHVGTFTDQGTFAAAAARLEDLRTLGVTAIELMPVGDFPGTRNWGYDGAALFAPARCYGTPDDLRGLVDAAHAVGLSVYLDVVYNHFGPDGAYVHAFSSRYFTDTYHTPWGRAVNLDGAGCTDVRRFFIENALHWIHEYHVDGLRLDATHALHDEGPIHFLAEFSTQVRTQAGRPVHLVAEDHRNLSRILQPISSGGFGFDGVWADDFHHQARVHLAGDRESYYEDYTGSTPDLAATLRQGWFYTGQESAHLDAPRGTDPTGVPLSRMIVCLQNHDQVGNRFDGSRLHQAIAAASYRAASAIFLLAPETPLLFMGQEWAATSPFLFFTDHREPLGQQVTAGRRAEFHRFSAFADPARHGEIPDPQDPATFERSRLDWGERRDPDHAGVLALYQRLLALRHEARAADASIPRPCLAVALDDDTLALQAGAGTSSLLVVARLTTGGAVEVRVSPTSSEGVGPGAPLQPVCTTEDDAFVPHPSPIAIASGRVTFSRPGAIIMRGARLARCTG